MTLTDKQIAMVEQWFEDVQKQPGTDEPTAIVTVDEVKDLVLAMTQASPAIEDDPGGNSGSRPAGHAAFGVDGGSRFNPGRWLPMAVAPPELETVVLWRDVECQGFDWMLATRLGHGWLDDYGDSRDPEWFTHWTPLPEPPAQGTPTRRAETTGSVGEADGGPVAATSGDAPEHNPVNREQG